LQFTHISYNRMKPDVADDLKQTFSHVDVENRPDQI